MNYRVGQQIELKHHNEVSEEDLNGINHNSYVKLYRENKIRTITFCETNSCSLNDSPYHFRYSLIKHHYPSIDWNTDI